MANAGASIDAFLRLDASEFDKSLNNVSATVTKFKESMLDIGKNSKEFTVGLSNTSRAVTNLMTSMEKLDNVDSKAITKFKNLATALQNIATAAQRMSVDVQRGSVGMEMLSTVIDIFNTGVSSAEVHLKATNAQLQALARNSREVTNSQNSTTQSTRQFSSEANAMENNLRRMKNELNMMALAVQKSQYSFNDFRTNVKYAFQDLANLQNAVQPLARVQEQIRLVKDQAKLMGAEFQRSRTELLNFANGGVEAFNKVRAGIASALEGTSSIINNQSGHFARLKSEIDQVSNSYRMLRLNAEGENVTLEKSSLALEKNSAEMMKNAEAKLRAMGYNGQLSSSEQRLANAEQQVSNSANREASSIQRANASMNQGVGSANRLTTATSRLGKAMSSLRMIGNLVGSMLAYNFAHKLLVATGETIHAKSEMEGYFKMLNFGQGEINSFNQALDRTVAQFQRVNKYSLGETISSIGVEFNLTTQEMEKAMKVTSMITSEYLRAGRNANEASLAVKDVLQGQFQRLSRETGVKGEDLKNAGWSGDTKDVLGLMKALEKVGHDRNWDVFAEKANSLNDILTITQNRFGEWSADMVNKVQPAIVGAFNMIMGTAQKLGGVLNGVIDWLGGDGIANNIAKWGLLATAISTAIGMLVSYRTGASLLQMAQMGLTGSISATVLGLEAETVAQYGTLTAIKSKILGVEAEKVATLSTKDAILSKILGLDAELVAQTSLKQGILDKAFAQELETMRLSGATKEEMLNTLALYENQLAQKSTIGLLSAQAMGLNMTTYAQKGFLVALLESKTGMDATKIASMGLAKKIALLGVSMIAPTALVGAFAVGIGILAFKMNDSAKAMERFNDILENGEKTVKENREAVQTYTDRLSHLKEELAKTKEGSLEYNQIQEQINATNKDLEVSNANVENSYKALQMAVSAKGNFEQAKTDMTIKKQGELAQAYMDAGYSMAEAYEMANTSLIDAEQGAEQLRQTLQKLAMIDYKNVENVNYLLSQFEDSGVDPEIGKKYLEQSTSLHDRMKKGMEKGMTDESFMGRLDGWLTYYQSQIENWMNNIGAMLETNDWGKVWDNVWKGIAHGFADLPYIKDFWGWVGKQINFDPEGSLKGSGWDGINQMIGKFFPTSESIGLKSIIESFDNNIKKPIMDWWNGFISLDWLNLGEGGDGTGVGFAKKIDPSWILQQLFGIVDGMDFTWATDFINNNIVTPISTAWNNFMADPLSAIGGVLGGATGIGGLLAVLLPSDGGVGIWEWTNTNIIQPFGQALWNGITSIPLVNTILQLFGLVDSENSGSAEKGRTLGEAFKTAIENKIRSIPILGDILQMLGVIPQANPDASSKGQTVGESIKNGLHNGVNGIANIISTEMSNVVNTLSEWAGQVYATAHDIGSRIINGIKDAMGMHSPSIISRELMPQEFGVYIPQAIMSSG